MGKSEDAICQAMLDDCEPQAAALIDRRGATHGDYGDVAAMFQRLVELMRAGPNWPALTMRQKTSLEMDAMKTARILCGNPHHADHWADKAGYATLIARELPQ